MTELARILDWLDNLQVPYRFTGSPGSMLPLAVLLHQSHRWTPEDARTYREFGTREQLSRWAHSMGFQ